MLRSGKHWELLTMLMKAAAQAWSGSRASSAHDQRTLPLGCVLAVCQVQQHTPERWHSIGKQQRWLSFGTELANIWSCKSCMDAMDHLLLGRHSLV